MRMIEQVAKAIAPVIERDNDIYWAGEYGRPMPQESAERVARAAIEAMRLHTAPMHQAMERSQGDFVRDDVWIAAIEAALAEAQ